MVRMHQVTMSKPGYLELHAIGECSPFCSQNYLPYTYHVSRQMNKEVRDFVQVSQSHNINNGCKAA